MLYDEPKNLLEKKLNEILKNQRDEDLLTDIVRLSTMKSARKDESLLAITELFDLLGSDKFAEVIALMDGRTVTFPTKDNFRQTMLIATTYYLKDVCGMSWADIKATLSDPTLNTVKIGINDAQFNAWLDEQTKKRITEDEGE